MCVVGKSRSIVIIKTRRGHQEMPYHPSFFAPFPSKVRVRTTRTHTFLHLFPFCFSRSSFSFLRTSPPLSGIIKHAINFPPSRTLSCQNKYENTKREEKIFDESCIPMTKTKHANDGGRIPQKIGGK